MSHPILCRLSNLYSMCRYSKAQTQLEQATYLVQPQPQSTTSAASKPRILSLSSYLISASINPLTSISSIKETKHPIWSSG
jgi:hypothetical protein